MAAQYEKDGLSLRLQQIDMSSHLSFEVPKKKIHNGPDVPFFLSSKAYTSIVTFLLQLNTAMFPREDVSSPSNSTNSSPEIIGFRSLLSGIDSIVDQAPPQPGPRRFGNVAFRTWYALLESKVDDLLNAYLPDGITSMGVWKDVEHTPLLELKSYLLGSFGSSQRLDYGTGHELSFIAFLGCAWKLGAFEVANAGLKEREIVLELIVPYLDLIRRLIKTYNLEPAGSHGVWGLDDHSFIPYIFGSAQFSPAIVDMQHIPKEGSLPGAPDPGGVATLKVVEQYRSSNLYFGAIGFIYDVKKGPFWEHSPVLYDISGVSAGWAKINKGMIKMYVAEVLSKFPVVQHFPFGSMFRWEKDDNGKEPMFASPLEGVQRADKPPLSVGSAPIVSIPIPEALRRIPPPRPGFELPANPRFISRGQIAPRPVASSASARTLAAQPSAMPMTAAPWASSGQMPPPTRTAWANGTTAQLPTNAPAQPPKILSPAKSNSGSVSTAQAATKAPWAK